MVTIVYAKVYIIYRRMIMNDKLQALGTTLAVTFAGYSWIEVNAILSAVASAVSIIISLITLISFVIKWWKKSNEDGKITIDEIEEGLDGVKDNLESIAEQINKEKKK